MAVTHYTLTATFTDLLGAAYDSTTSKVVAWIETNVADDEGIVDDVADLIALGPQRQTADSTGLVEFANLVGSDSDPEDINLAEGTLQYRVTAEYVNAVTRKRGPKWSSGWFSLTDNINLADVVSEQYAPAAWQTTFMADAQTLLDEMEEISGLTGEDEAVEFLFNDDGSLTRIAGDAIWEAQGDLVYNVVKAPFSANFDGAADCTAAIQAALDAAEAAVLRTDSLDPALGTATVVLPAGWGKVTGLSIASKVRLIGQGDSTILLLTGSSNQNVIQSKNFGHRTNVDRGIHVEDIRIIGNEANQAADLCPQTYVTTDTVVSTVSTTLPVDDTTGFDSSGLAWVGFQVVAYTGKTSNTLTGVTLYSGSDTLRKMTWVTPYASKGHLVAIQGANCHVKIYGSTAAGSGIYFQGPDPIASGGVIVPENTVMDGTRIRECRRYGLEVGQNATDSWIGRCTLGPDNLAGALLIRSPNWKFSTLHLIGTFGDTIHPIPQAILVSADTFRGNNIIFDTWPGTQMVFDGTINALARYSDIDVAQTEHFQCSWGAAAAGMGVLFRGIKVRTVFRGPSFDRLNMTAPNAKCYVNGPFTRTVGVQNLTALTGGKLQVTNAMDFSPKSSIGGPVLIGVDSLDYTGRQMNFTKLTTNAAIGDTSITVADTTGFESAGTITLLAEDSGQYTSQIVTYTGKTGTTFTGIPAVGAGSITAVTLESGERGVVGQHFLTGVTGGTLTSVAAGTSLYCDAQTVTVQAMQVTSPTMRSFQIEEFGMQPTDTFWYVGGSSGGARMVQVSEKDRLLTTGEEDVDREEVQANTIALTSGLLRVTYFTAQKAEAITQIRAYLGAVAAGATPTIARFGIWTADDDGGLLSLVGSTTNDTALFSGTLNTAFTKSLTATMRTLRGQRYAIGSLCVTGATAPQMTGATNGALAALFNQSPVKCMTLGGQTNLPTSAAAGTLTASLSRVYHVLLP